MFEHTSFFDNAMEELPYNSPNLHGLTLLDNLPELSSPTFKELSDLYWPIPEKLPEPYPPTLLANRSPTLQGMLDLELDAGSSSFSATSPPFSTVNPMDLTLGKEEYPAQDCDVAADLDIAPSSPLSPNEYPLLDSPNLAGPVEEVPLRDGCFKDKAADSDSDYLLTLLSEQSFLKGELESLKEENMNLRRLLKNISEDGRTSKVAGTGKSKWRSKASRVRKPSKGETPASLRRSGRKRAVVNYCRWQWLPDDEVVIID
ncbi:hypothetical protein BDW68DRAFT_180648 [Aspergillus falconensis]